MSDAEERPADAGTGEAAAGDAATKEAEGTATGHATPLCQVAWCPVCFAVGAVQPIQPEVVEHLLRAGTEMMLAFRSVLDARVNAEGDGGTPGGTPLEKIDLG